MPHTKDGRRRAMMAALSTRLMRVRGNMTDAEFGRLLVDMVIVAERFAEIDAKPGAQFTPDMNDDEIRRLINLPPIT